MKKSWIGLAATGLMWLAPPGWAGSERAVQPAHLTNPTDDRRAALLATSARDALAGGDALKAVQDAEAATLILPTDAANRALLGRAYLAAGRFASADTAFGDALTLDPSLAGIAVSRALAQIAMGQAVAARTSLAVAAGHASEADIGLALALLGDADAARDRLIAATRAPGADARVRQNLAFAYALEGRWNDAAAIAAQDVPADKLADRLRRWAMVAQLKANPAMQLGAVLGVLPAVDNGQPLALALAVPQPAGDAAPLQAEALAPGAVQPTANDDPAAIMADAAIQASPAAIPASMPADLPESAPVPVMATDSSAAAIPTLRAFSGPVAALAPKKAAARPIQARFDALPVPHARKPSLLRQGGAWAVQLGAFSSARRTQAAWLRLSSRAHFLNAHMPSGSGLLRGGAALYRLSVSGFTTRADATRMCLRIKAAGGACFVRAASGEKPMQWAMDNRGGRAA